MRLFVGVAALYSLLCVAGLLLIPASEAQLGDQGAISGVHDLHPPAVPAISIVSDGSQVRLLFRPIHTATLTPVGIARPGRHNTRS